MTSDQARCASLALAERQFSVGITGHRSANAAYAEHADRIAGALSHLFDRLAALANPGQGPRRQPTCLRLVSALADGTDLVAAELAVAKGWALTAPLPFGNALNIQINTPVDDAEQALAMLRDPQSVPPAVRAAAARLAAISAKARKFELAEQDAEISALFERSLRFPADTQVQQAYFMLSSERAVAAGELMIDQADLVVAVWDGTTPGLPGGTRHTMTMALSRHAPLLWIDARNPDRMQLLDRIEMLSPRAALADAPDDSGAIDRQLQAIMEERLFSGAQDEAAMHVGQWYPHSRTAFHAYRRVETLFGAQSIGQAMTPLRQDYGPPEAIADGSGADLLKAVRALPGVAPDYTGRIAQGLLQRFAWADGLATYLSDAYRGGMIANFLLSAAAIIIGVAYLPIVDAREKFPFALAEFLLLLAIVAITVIGSRGKWHERWFETRRVAEYLRHAPIMLLMGTMRAAGRWPQGKSRWPEYYARQAIQQVGLPELRVTHAYLTALLSSPVCAHVIGQRDYHRAKAARLARVHHRLDHLSEMAFLLALLSVGAYLAIYAGAAAGLFDPDLPYHLAKLSTFLGVLFPTLGGALAGIRYFADFERFAAISDRTARRLEELEQRLQLLLDGPADHITFGRARDIVVGIDEIMMDEIEAWQSVFGLKKISVPV